MKTENAQSGVAEVTRRFSLHSLLRDVTERRHITTMTEQEKFRRLLSVFLGNQAIRGWFRPRDLIFDPVATDAILFAIRLNEYVLDLPSQWGDGAFSNFIDAPSVRLREERSSAGFSVGEFASYLGLALMEKASLAESLPEEHKRHNEIRRFYRAGTYLLLRLVENFPVADSETGSWGVDASRCRIELEIAADDPKTRLDNVKNKSQDGSEEFAELVKGILSRSAGIGSFSLNAVRSFNINKEFLNRWSRSSMRRGASYLAYAAVAILREDLIRQFGPECILHDFGGWLCFILPDKCRDKFDKKWIDSALAASFRGDGWIRGRFQEIVDRKHVSVAFSEDIMCRDSFPQMAAKRLIDTPLDLKDLSTVSLPNWDEKVGPLPEFPAPDNPCPHCKRHASVPGKFRRWKIPKDNWGCGICSLIADGTAAWWRHHLWASAIAGEAEDKEINVHFHAETPKNLLVNGEVEFFCVDGDGVGDIIRGTKGVQSLRQVSLLIHHDLQERLRRAVNQCLEETPHKGTIGFELCWIGGDDLMMRIQPTNHEIFKKCFDGHVWVEGNKLEFSVGKAVAKSGDAALIAGMEKAMADLKANKDRKKGKLRS